MINDTFFVSRLIPDYTGNKDAAQELANKFKQYYKDRGVNVDVGVESIPIYNSQGDRVYVHYKLKHNVSFSVKDIAASRFLRNT